MAKDRKEQIPIKIFFIIPIPQKVERPCCQMCKRIVEPRDPILAWCNHCGYVHYHYA